MRRCRARPGHGNKSYFFTFRFQRLASSAYPDAIEACNTCLSQQGAGRSSMSSLARRPPIFDKQPTSDVCVPQNAYGNVLHNHPVPTFSASSWTRHTFNTPLTYSTPPNITQTHIHTHKHVFCMLRKSGSSTLSSLRPVTPLRRARRGNPTACYFSQVTHAAPGEGRKATPCP